MHRGHAGFTHAWHPLQHEMAEESHTCSVFLQKILLTSGLTNGLTNSSVHLLPTTIIS